MKIEQYFKKVGTNIKNNYQSLDIPITELLSQCPPIKDIEGRHSPAQRLHGHLLPPSSDLPPPRTPW